MSNASSTTSSPDHEMTTYLEVKSRLDMPGPEAIDVKTASPLVVQLDKLLSTPYTSFSCDHPTTIMSAKIRLCGNPAGTFGSPDVDLFLEKSQPSAFGRGDLTVMDASYRKGREVVSADFLMNKKGWDKLTTAICDNVSSTLFHGRSVDAQLYKVAIYEAGGHFDWYRDTTHGDEHHATALVALGTTWTGGNLLLRQNDKEISLDLHAESDSPHIVAFYTDVEHKVEPVVEGSRIVLQFDIFVDGDDDSAFESDPLHAMSYRGRRRGAVSGTDSEIPGNVDVISRMIEIMRTMHVDIDEIALPLQHLYRKASIKSAYLKGIDLVLYQKLEAAGFGVSLHPVVLRMESGYDGWSDRDTDISAYKFESSYYEDSGSETQSTRRTELHLPVNAAIVNVSSKDYVEHTGNEPQAGVYGYFGGTMFVRATAKVTESPPRASGSKPKKRKRKTGAGTIAFLESLAVKFDVAEEEHVDSEADSQEEYEGSEEDEEREEKKLKKNETES